MFLINIMINGLIIKLRILNVFNEYNDKLFNNKIVSE